MNSIKTVTNIYYPFDSIQKTDYIKVHLNFDDELKQLLERSGYKNDFIKKFRFALKYLEKLKSQCVHNSNLFEKLRNEDGLYSMRLFGQKNIRILFVFLNINGRDKAILLCAFEEKEPSDYRKPTKQAHQRRNEIIEISKKGKS